MTCRGTVKNGVVIFDDAIHLRDGTVVKIEPIDLTPGPDSSAQNGLFSAAERAKATGIADLARNHDHYLYGHPKED